MIPTLFDLSTVLDLIESHGLLLIAPLALVEGPIVTVIAAWLASLGHLDLFAVAAVVILADLAGDVILYGIGRRGPALLPLRWRAWLRIDEGSIDALVDHYRHRGGRILIFGKLTHSLGALLLVAAGAARMPFGRFLAYNTLATVPKSLFFVGIGWGFGAALGRVDAWIFWASMGLLVVGFGVGIWFLRRHRGRMP